MDMASKLFTFTFTFTLHLHPTSSLSFLRNNFVSQPKLLSLT